MITTSLSKLPPQPLPGGEALRANAIVVTIWFVLSLGLTVLLQWKIRDARNRNRMLWPEFKIIRTATGILTFWYLFVVADRWLRYYERQIKYDYILFEPLIQIFQLISTLLFLWGTFAIVWNEVEKRFERKRSKVSWWLSAKVILFAVGLVTCYFWVLRIATAAVWLKFSSMNVISDVATKRNGFEMAMTFLFMAFSGLTVAAIVATVFYRATKQQEQWAMTRIYAVIASILLMARCMMETIIVFRIHTSKTTTRSDMLFPYDISFGLLTILYLVLMWIQAWQISSKLDMGSKVVSNIQEDIRTAILNQLRKAMDEDPARKPPPFRIILENTLRDLSSIIAEGPRSGHSTMPPDKKLEVGKQFIEKTLRKNFGHLGDPTLTTAQRAASTTNTPQSSFGRNGRDRGGRHTAPLPKNSSSRLFDSLYTASNPTIRNAQSEGDMRRQRMQQSTSYNSLGQRYGAPSPVDWPSTSTAGGFGYNSNMPALDEEYYQDPPPPLPPQQPMRSFISPDQNAPSFAARAAPNQQYGGNHSSNSTTPYSVPRNFSSPVPSIGQPYDTSDPPTGNSPTREREYPFPPQTEPQYHNDMFYPHQQPAELHNSPAFQHRQPIIPSPPETQPTTAPPRRTLGISPQPPTTQPPLRNAPSYPPGPFTPPETPVPGKRHVSSSNVTKKQKRSSSSYQQQQTQTSRRNFSEPMTGTTVTSMSQKIPQQPVPQQPVPQLEPEIPVQQAPSRGQRRQLDQSLIPSIHPIVQGGGRPRSRTPVPGQPVLPAQTQTQEYRAYQPPSSQQQQTGGFVEDRDYEMREFSGVDR
ncbi:hypothetical protein QBC38DRAFT_254443 [Podospora fimiseda]|uniref:Uncharacterized protein n=1 Tax=Podospora fimiseda TaxID=252190 RepID=A0AAN7BLT2_9PEZI|nr:hypothetical protein QBC38DRAFT_254443 [Podospora fimiseda]